MVRVDMSNMMERLSDTLANMSLSPVCSLLVLLGVLWISFDYARMLRLHRKMVSNHLTSQLTCIS